MRLMVIDDEPTIRSFFRAALETAGYTDLVFATDGLEALSMLGIEYDGVTPVLGGDEPNSEPVVDLILLDVMMPNSNGIDICARIKADRRYNDIPVLIVTSITDDEHLARAFEAGATDYLHKPVERAPLLARVRAGLQLKIELDRRRYDEAEFRRIKRILSSSARNAFDEQRGILSAVAFESAVTWHARAGKPFAVLLAELGTLAAIRVADGLQASEQILETFFQTILQIPGRLGDLAADFDGERLALLLIGADLEEARQRARLIAQAVRDLQLTSRHALHGEHLQATIGGVAFAAPNEDARTATEVALAALDGARRDARGIVILTR